MDGVHGDPYRPEIIQRWPTDGAQRQHRAVDGSLLMVDVSGFTKLSERLAARGPIGAEELTEIVGTVFGGMLDDLRAWGGDVLTFGGDALLTLFTDDGHEARAAAAALRIQAGMRPFRNFLTDAGRVSLRVSAGVASGPVDLFVVGRGPPTLVVAGPTASLTCALEGMASAGEVVISDATAAALPSAAVGRRVESDGVGGPLLRGSLAQLGLAPRPPLRPASGPEEEAARGREAEHRLVTIGFVQFRGSDAVIGDGGADRLGEALDDLVDRVQHQCGEYGVTLVSTDVDRDAGKIILVAGAPRATEFDEDNMLHVARSVVDLASPLAIRVGVHRGRAYVGDVGTSWRRTWTVMGDATNTAARVMGKAPVSGVLATTTVLDRTRLLFALDPLPPFSVKGKRDPLHAAVVGAPVGERAPALVEDVPLIGRETELATLVAALGEASAGRPAGVELVGEPGIGKSRLVQATLAEARGFRVVTIAAGPYGIYSPYFAVRPALRDLLGLPPEGPDEETESVLRATVAQDLPELEEWLPLLGIPLGLRLEATERTAALAPEFARARLHAVTSRLLQSLLGAEPALLLLEDAHWLDEASADLLAFLLRVLRNGPRMVLLTRRPGTPRLTLAGLPSSTVIELVPLDQAQARQLLIASLPEGDALGQEAMTRLLDRGGGNPLFLNELLVAVRAGGDTAEMPDTLEGLIGARIDQLDPADRAVLREASILGVSVSVPLLEALVDDDPALVHERIRRLDAFLVEEGQGRLRFRHALLRDAAYNALPFRLRRTLHARAADLLRTVGLRGDGSEAEAELLAVHEHAAQRWDRAWESSTAAGRRALDNGAPVEAMQFFRLAMDSARHLPDLPDAARRELAGTVAHAAQLAGDVDAAVAALRTARALARAEPLALAELCRREGRLRERARHYGQALAWFTRGLRALESVEGHEAQLLFNRLKAARGAARLRQGRLRAALPELHAAIEGARRADDQETLAHAYYLMDWALTDLGSPEVEEYRGKALEIYERLGDRAGMARSLNNLGVDAYYEGRWDEAVAYYERAREANEAVGDVIETANVENNIAEVRLDQGRIEEARVLLQDALATWASAQSWMGVGMATANLGLCALRTGDLDGAAARFVAAREAYEKIDARAEAFAVYALEAEHLLCRRRPDEALERVGAIRARAKEIGVGPALLAGLQRLAAHAKLQSGDRDGGLVRLDEALALAGQVDAAWEQARCLQTLARVRGAEGTEAADQAAALTSRLGVIASPVIPV